MDARELTKHVYTIENTIYELRAEVDFLTNENTILRRKIEDIEVDVKMLENMRR